MDIAGVLKDNIKVFLPVLGLIIVLIAFFTIDLEEAFFTDITPGGTISKKIAPTMSLESDIDYKAKVKTSMGDFTIDLFESDTPKNVNNFVFLSEEGFYKGLKFHRVIEKFIIQTGDPQGDGYGNAGYYIRDEIVKNIKFDAYSVAMANEDRPNTNSSQFFITLEGGDFSHLNGKYTIIGKVTNGFNIVEEIGKSRVNENNVPLRSIVVEDIEILKERK